MVIPGDVVRYGSLGAEHVVVDVAEEWAVLRRRDDVDDPSFVAVLTGGLESVGHLESLPGWVEDEPGVWRQI